MSMFHIACIRFYFYFTWYNFEENVLFYVKSFGSLFVMKLQLLCLKYEMLQVVNLVDVQWVENCVHACFILFL